MTRREWQLILKAALTPLQYRYVAVEEGADGMVAQILEPRTLQPVATLALADPSAAVAALKTALGNVRAPDPEGVTIIPHYPGP